MPKHHGQLWTIVANLFAVAIVVSACHSSSSVTKPPVPDGHDDVRRISRKEIILDFEKEVAGVAWIETGQSGSTQSGGMPQKGEGLLAPSSAEGSSEAMTQKGERSAGETGVVLSRSATRPLMGLWCLKASLGKGREVGGGGMMVHRFEKPMAWGGGTFNVVTAGVMHTATAQRNGEYIARLFVVDAAGKKFFGDPLPVTGQWQELLLDLKTASEEEGGGGGGGKLAQNGGVG
ncbi:MAG: hypothetical protein FWD61_16025, partial [Phycisphaerales bacterium]|nr:hypothetical protein [Phycisphaerales bacterium]